MTSIHSDIHLCYPLLSPVACTATSETSSKSQSSCASRNAPTPLHLCQSVECRGRRSSTQWYIFSDPLDSSQMKVFFSIQKPSRIDRHLSSGLVKNNFAHHQDSRSCYLSQQTMHAKRNCQDVRDVHQECFDIKICRKRARSSSNPLLLSHTSPSITQVRSSIFLPARWRRTLFPVLPRLYL